MLGFAICGSFCNFKEILPLMSEAKRKYKEILPIMSENSRNTDTRFFKAQDFYEKVTEIAERDVICSIVDAEPIGPKKLVDMMVICPCTGNTLSKLAYGITDTPVTMAVKSHLRSGGKLLIALSTNDALSGSFEAIAKMKNRKNVFFVPMYQDDTETKPSSLTFVKPLFLSALEKAYEGKQLEPMLTQK